MGQRLADAGKVPEGRRQGTEPAPATVMAGAILVQQFFHPSRFQQQTTTERSRQRQFAVADGGQAVGEFKQGPAAPADQVVKLLVVDRSLCRLVGGERVSGRVVHDVFLSPVPAPGSGLMVDILQLSGQLTSEVGYWPRLRSREGFSGALQALTKAAQEQQGISLLPAPDTEPPG